MEENTKPYARITLEHDSGDQHTVTHEGIGPIDAAFAAVCAITDVSGVIKVLDLHHEAEEGVVRADAVVMVDGRDYSGKGKEVDIADAAVAAFVAAINQAAAMRAGAFNLTNEAAAS